MIPDQFCESVLMQLREAQIPIAQNLASGSCKSYDEYKYLAGQVQGLQQAEEIIKDIYSNLVEAKNVFDGRDALY